MKSSRRDKATAVAVVALLHGAALLCVSQSTQLPPPHVLSAAALPPTLIRVALDTTEPPRPSVQRRASHRAQPIAPVPALQPEQVGIASAEPVAPVAAPAFAPASAPASAALRQKADAPITEVAYLDNPPPTYPAASLRMREQGRVLVSALVSRQGLVEEVQVKESSGSARLDAAALTSVRAWRFVPAKRAGAAIAARINVPVRFELSDD